MSRMGKVGTAPVSSSPNVILPASMNRVAVIFSPPVANRYTLSNESGGADGAGIVVTAGGPPVELRIEVHGDVVRRAWYALTNTGSETVGYLEVIE